MTGDAVLDSGLGQLTAERTVGIVAVGHDQAGVSVGVYIGAIDARHSAGFLMQLKVSSNEASSDRTQEPSMVGIHKVVQAKLLNKLIK